MSNHEACQAEIHRLQDRLSEVQADNARLRKAIGDTKPILELIALKSSNKTLRKEAIRILKDLHE